MPVGQGCSTAVVVESAVADENSARPKSMAQGHAAQCSPLLAWCPFHYTLRFLSWGSLRRSWGRWRCDSPMSLEEFNRWDKLSAGRGGVGKTLREAAACLRLRRAHWTWGVPLQRLALHRDKRT